MPLPITFRDTGTTQSSPHSLALARGANCELPNAWPGLGSLPLAGIPRVRRLLTHFLAFDNDLLDDTDCHILEHSLNSWCFVLILLLL